MKTLHLQDILCFDGKGPEKGKVQHGELYDRM